MIEEVHCQKRVLELLSASENNEGDHVNSLLNEDITLINAQDSDGYTSLHRASYNNNSDIVKMLLSRGADTDMKTLDGWQPLHSACKWNSLACAEVLIKNGADVNARTNGGQTPLHIAASNPEARETLKLLLSLSYIEIDVHNSCKETPYQIALRCGKNADLFESFV